MMPDEVPVPAGSWSLSWRVWIVTLLVSATAWRRRGLARAVEARRAARKMVVYMVLMICWILYGLCFS